jgi:hypothetical protein
MSMLLPFSMSGNSNRKNATCIRSALIHLFLLLCAGAAFAASNAWDSVLIADVPHVTQRPDFCGEACTEMWLRKLGHAITQNDVFNASGVDPLKARGCYAPEMASTLKQLGFSVGDVWSKVPAGSNEALQAQWTALHADLKKGIPSMVCMRTDNTASAREHIRLILGYDAKDQEVIYHEPAEKNGEYARMKLSEFLDCWPLKYETNLWTVIRFRLESGTINKPAHSEGFSNADYAQHMMTLKQIMPTKGFTVVIRNPFVVIGDEPPDMVRRRAEQTVAWATEKLKKAYFKKDPARIIDIWLFKDKKSYEKHAREIFNDTPTTPYGYSSTEHNALIMNIGTGGGTLVHEMVHPFIDTNFPICPSWFNEGLASLYEQSAERNGEIVGLTNWRLAGLQAAIRDQEVPSFKALTSTTKWGFYQDDRTTNYAQARYLCYYLQEKGLLTKFYHEFVKNCGHDPTGYETLKTVLGEKDMDAFKIKWEQFVLSLTFP